MKIKIIDLLNKIANNEEVPEKIKYDGIALIYDVEIQDYWCYYDKYLFEYKFAECNDFLNDYVEIIEEPKKLEKLDVALLGQCDNWLRCPTNKVTKQDVELNPYIIDNIRENTLYFQRKINELIDEINNLKEND